MIEPIVYNSIEKKNLIEAQLNKAYTGPESLVITLNLMDLLASFNGHNPKDENYIDWIILKTNRHDSK